MLAYVRFHPRAHACEHCGAGLLRGAVELSDGRKYGRQCAARAMGKRRETSAMASQIDVLRRDALHFEYKALAAERSGWTWIAKGYGGNCGFGSTDVYRRADGSVVLDVQDTTTASVLDEKAGDRVLGWDWRTGRMFVAMTPEEVSASPFAGGVRWTTKRWAEWQFGKGWME